jgi:UDP-2,3-diacylglucosamine hydrolase
METERDPGPGYKRMKRYLQNPWLFRWLHPDIGVGLAQYLSVKKQTYFR